MHELSIDSLSTEGDGIGRLESGQVVFVPGALPGDRLQVQLTRKLKRVQHAQIVAVLEPGGERVASGCDVHACGGCPLRSFSEEGQSRSKRDRVAQTLLRIAKQDVGELLGPVVRVGDGWRYRHRARLHARWTDDRWSLGYHARRSHRIVPLRACPVLRPELEAASLALAGVLAPLPRYLDLQHVEISHSRLDGRVAARIHAGGPASGFGDAASGLKEAGLAGLELVTPDGGWRQGDLELRYDHGRAEEFELLSEPGVFTQANPSANDRLVDAVSRALPVAEATRVLELHAGVGNFSLPLALAGAELFTAENMRNAVLLAQRNAHQAGTPLHAHFLEDIDALTDGGPVPPLASFDAVLLNPPRIGAQAVAQVLAESGPKRVVYLSCDPATLARDVQTLVAGGYRIEEVEAFDMFPQTPHVEVLVHLQRVRRGQPILAG